MDSRSRLVATVAVAVCAMAFELVAAGPANFKPDGMVTGSSLSGFHVLGDADWKAQNGELVGTAKPGAGGGWLVMDKGFQDVQLYTSYRCTGGCKSGILLRAQKTPDGGMTGVYVSLTEGDTTAYWIITDPGGKDLPREPLAAPAGRGGGGGGAARGGAPAAAAAPGAATGAAAAPPTAAPTTPPAGGGQGAGPATGRATPPGTQVG